MAVSIVGTPTTSNQTSESTSRSISSHTVASGTDTLMVVIMTRSFDGVNPPAAWTVTWNSVAVSEAFNTFDDTPFGSGRVGVWIGYLHSPTTGAQTLSITTATTQRGLLVALFNLAGNKTSGSPLGTTAFQRYVTSASTTVNLSMTAQSTTADNLVICGYMISQNTLLTNFTAAPTADTYTSVYSAQFGNFPHGTIRYRVGDALTISTGAEFAGSTTGNIGGFQVEIMAASAEASDTVAESMLSDFSASFVEPSSARRTDLGFWNGRTTWTYVQAFQADSAADDRIWVRIGSASVQSFAVRGRVDNGQGSVNVYRVSYDLADGSPAADSETNSQTTGPAVLCVVQEPGFGARLYFQGRRSSGYRRSPELTGGLSLVGALEIGAHSGSTPAPTQGKLGRVMIDSKAWSEGKASLISNAMLNPASVYGVGDEEVAADIASGGKRSPVALPTTQTLIGEPAVTFTPQVADPDNTDWVVTGVGAPLNGMAEIAGDRQIRYTPNAGYTGSDTFTYIVAGDSKSSTGQVTISSTLPSLVANPDSFTVTKNSTNFVYDPTQNDTLSPGAVITAVSDPPNGTASIEPDGLRVRYTPTTNYTGADSFTYTLADQYQSKSATISVTVQEAAVASVNAVNDTVTTTKGTAVDINVLANDTGSGSLQVVSVTDPPHGAAAIISSGSLVRYTPDSGYVGADAFDYTAQLVGGAASDTATVNVTVQDTATQSGAWGTGPKSGFTYHLGGRMGNWPTFTNANQATALNRPNHPDIQDNWIDYQKMPTATADAWKWISGCDPAQNADDHTQIGGVFTSGQWNLAYSSSRTQQICKFNIALNPPGLSTKLATGEALGEKWRFWFDLANGNYNAHWRRLGKRFAYKDQLAGRQTGTSASHFAAGRVLPRGANLIVLGWEINDSQRWAYFGHRSPSTASAASPYPTNTYCYTKVGDGLAQIITSFNAGYESFAGQRCPYFFGTRPTSRCQAGQRYRDVLWNWSDASLCKWVGQSAHHSEQNCTTTNPRAIWFDTTTTSGAWSREGLNAIGELATKHGWKVYMDETGQHFAGPFAQYSSGRRADLFWAAIHDWFMANPSLQGGVSFYQGDSYNGVCNTSLITNPDPGGPHSAWWPQASQYWYDTYRA